ncbi:hypothetical protein AB1Y20_000880 [Prymnesium parvum]|uniref:Uncharacterized protein n=1 Tax=Prymnesium parvum TaxID=97485 RepID=A0AB34K9W0_PRYPA
MGGSKPPLMLGSCHSPVVGDDGASCGSCRCLRASEKCTADMWADHASDSPNPHFCNVNSGAFLLKNSAETRRVMRIWAFAGDGKCAVYAANSDQKCLMQLKQLFPKHIDVLSAKWFNAPSWFERSLNATGYHIKQQHLKSKNASAEDRFSCFGSHLFGNAPPGIGQTESVNFMWNAPRRVLPESSNDCELSRRCEFGGKLSALPFRGRVRLFSRSTRSSNSEANVGLIHMASSAEIVNFGQKNIIQAVSKWSEWQKVQVQGVGTAKSGLIAELFVVQPWFNNSLLALYPAVFNGSGGIYYSISIDAVKWSAPVQLLQTGIYGNRTRAQPIRIIRKYLYVLQNVELSVPADVPPDYDPFLNEGRPCSDSSPPYLQRFNVTTAMSETGHAQLQLDGEGEIVSVEPLVMQ